MAVSRLSKQSLQNAFPKGNTVWDGTTNTSSFDCLGSVYLSTATATVTFSSIPQTYTHLQIRGKTRDSRTGTSTQSLMMRMNNDSSSNYSFHVIEGSGGSVGADVGYSGSSTQIRVGLSPTADATANIFGSFICDILDYTNTTTYKTSRSIYGEDLSGSGTVGYSSGMLTTNTNAITRLDFYPTNSMNLVPYTQISLYGIK